MKKVLLTAKEKKQINNAVHEAVKKTYFDVIPLNDIFDACKKFDAVPLQEDDREWSGFLTGGIDKTEQIYFDLGRGLINDDQYNVIRNACLVLSYFQVASGRLEILAYVS